MNFYWLDEHIFLLFKVHGKPWTHVMFFQHLVPFDVRMTQRNSQFPIDEPHGIGRFAEPLTYNLVAVVQPSTMHSNQPSGYLVSPKLDEEQLRWKKKTLCIKAFGVTSLGINNDQGWKHESVVRLLVASHHCGHVKTHGSGIEQGYQYFRWSKANGGFLGKGYSMSRINSYLVSFFPSACWSGGFSCLAIWQNAEEKDL